MAEQSFTVSVPADFDPTDRAEFVDAIIDYVIDRTKRGIGIKNNRRYDFPDYTPEYAASKGVGVGDVDLTDSGAMLEAMRVLRQNGEEVTIGFRTGSNLGKRAGYNDDQGRTFLGLNKGELKGIENFVRNL